MRNLMIKKFVKRAVSCMFVVLVIFTMCIGCFAAEEDVSAAVSGVNTLFGDVSSIFTFTNIVSMIGIVIGSAAVLTLAWFGLRKVISIIQRALKKGRVSV